MPFNIKVYTTEQRKKMKALLEKLATTNPELAKVIHGLACMKAMPSGVSVPINVFEGFIPLTPVILFLLCLANVKDACEIAANIKKGDHLPPKDSRFWKAEEMYKEHFPESEREFNDTLHTAVVHSAIELIKPCNEHIEMCRLIEAGKRNPGQ
jgi:hypothetical protein